jgi:hypothetical protein
MIVVEILIGLIIASVIITGIAKIGAPMAESYAAKLKTKYEELGPEGERLLQARLAALEEEVRALKQQVSNLQATADFNARLAERATESDVTQDAPTTLKITPEKEKR